MASVCIFVCVCPVWADKVIYVDDDAPPAGDGTSWTTAYTFLQDALADANSSEKPIEIRVAEGLYKPDRNSTESDGTIGRYAIFQMPNKITLKGGFAGFDTPDPNERDIMEYETILSGDLEGNDSDGFVWERMDNSYRVVSIVGDWQSMNDHNNITILDGLTITGGYASKENTSANSMGAGIYIKCSNVVINACSIVGNWANVNGGGVYSESSNPQIINCTFRENLAQDGGAIFTTTGYDFVSSEVTLRNCVFEENKAEGEGGGIYNKGMCNVTLTGCQFIENTALEGGAIYNIDFKGLFKVSLSSCTFTANVAERYGGAISNYGNSSYTTSSAKISDCVFTRNRSRNGAAVNSYHWSITLNKCSFNENLGNITGAVEISAASPVISECVFYKNACGELRYGGAACISGDNPQLNKCVFIANTGYIGGALYLHGNPAILDNCLFAGNRALTYPHPNAPPSGLGGAVMCTLSSVFLNNCTFVGNYGRYGNGLTCDPFFPCDAHLTNCIMQNGGDEIWHNEESTINVQYSNIEGGWIGYSNIDVDPCFVDSGYWDPNGTPEDASDDFWVDGDYHLKSQAGRWEPDSRTWVQDDATSPCIDAGDPNYPIGYESFPNGGIINMGAYGGTAEASKSYFGGPVCETIIAGDLNGDCKVDSADFAILAGHWLGSFGQ